MEIKRLIRWPVSVIFYLYLGDKKFSNAGEGGGQTFWGKDFKTEGGGQTKVCLKGKV